MQEADKQAALSALRTLLTVIGASLAAHGVINETTFNEVIGALMVLVPLIWGIADKYFAEHKTQIREDEAATAAIKETTK